MIINNKQYINDLKEIVNLDCGTFNVSGVTQVSDFIEKKFRPLGFSFKRINVGEKVANLLIGTNCLENNFDLVISGHMDTVFPDGTSEEIPLKIDGDIVYGAGIQDMKCGIINTLYAMQELNIDKLSQLKIALIFSPDEEVGSRFSRDTIMKFVKKSKLALVVESAPKLDIATKIRKSIASFDINIKGKSAHSSRPKEGASAIKVLGTLIEKLYNLEDLDRGITVNIGLVSGGIGQNTIAENVDIVFEMRHLNSNDYNKSKKDFDEIINTKYETNITVNSKIKSIKPPMEEVGDSKMYQELIKKCANELNIDLNYVTAAGGSDGNYIASVGVPVIDSMGGVGKGAHTKTEYIELSQTIKRVELLKKIIEKLIDNK